jgi:hypothetical protein
MLISYQLQFVCPCRDHADSCGEEEHGGVIERDVRSNISIGDVFDIIQTKQETK